ncbi:MDR family MFS transporter [Paenibacillus sp. GCM10027626]|uniref:MDR family MFS transporter n=1 Tax=Paenibacillus sp. GCM10027626 TaxID=3273411 RepID=UPI00362616C5
MGTIQAKQTNTRVVTLALLVATFLTAIEGTVVSTAMPKIVSDLQGIKLMNWVFAVYLLVSAVTVPVFGKLSDLYGRKRIFMIGTVIFLIGSSLCGLAQTMEQLIVFRAVQGIGAGAILPITSTIMADIYPHEKRAKMIGLISTMWAIAGVAGPLVGGFFVDQMTWHWIFYMNIPFGGIAMIMIGMSLHESLVKKKQPIDYWGTITFMVGMLALLFALQKGGEDGGWTSPLVISLVVAAVVIIRLFVWIETKAKEPLLPLKLFTIEGISASNAVSLLISALLIGLMVYIPMWIQGVSGYGATISGIVIMPMSITWMLGSFYCGKLMMKRGARVSTLLGMAVLTVSAGWLLFIGKVSSTIHFYAVSALLGIGFGIVFTLCTVTVQSAVGWQLRGTATASNMFFRTLGQTIGVAVFGTYFNSQVSKAMNDGKEAAAGLNVDQMNQLINPDAAGALPAEVQSSLRDILVSALHDVFVVLFIIAIIGIIMVPLLPRRKAPEKSAREAAVGR